MSADRGHTSDHEPLLEALLAGDLPDEGASVRAQLASCPVCRVELEELPRLAQGLDRLGREHREAVETAVRSASASDEELMLRAWRDRLGGSSSARGWRSPRPWLVAVVAAAALVALVRLTGVWRSSPEPSPPVIMGGAEGFTLVAPKETNADFSVFRWEYDAPSGTTYHVLVWSADAEGRLLGQSDEWLSGKEWRPDPDSYPSWPDRIRWDVIVQKPDEDEFSVTGFASR